MSQPNSDPSLMLYNERPKEWGAILGRKRKKSIFLDTCRDPAQEIPPMTRSCREAWWVRRVGPQGFPLEFPEHLPPKPASAYFTVLCFPPTLLTLTGGCPPTTFFLEKVNLELLDNKSPGHNKSVSIQKPLWWLSSLPARLFQLCMWLFAASRPQEAQEA